MLSQSLLRHLFLGRFHFFHSKHSSLQSPRMEGSGMSQLGRSRQCWLDGVCGGSANMTAIPPCFAQ